MKNQRFPKTKIDQVNLTQPLGRTLILLFSEFERELFAELSKQMPSVKVTPADHQVLRSIKPDGSTIVEIAKLTGTSKQAVSKSVSSLQKRGLVAKSSHKSDGRACLVIFSAKGLHLAELALKIVAKIEKRYEKLIGTKELAKIKTGLKILFDDYLENKTSGEV